MRRPRNDCAATSSRNRRAWEGDGMRLLVRGRTYPGYVGPGILPVSRKCAMPSRERLDQGRRRRASSPAQPSATIQFSATPDVEHPVDEEFTGMLVVESLPFESTPASGGETAPASAPSFVPASTPASGL